MTKRVGKNKTRARKKSSIVVAIGGAAAAGLVSWGWLGLNGPDRHPNLMYSSAGVHERHERGTSLSPALFVGQTARSYEIAQEIPEILDQLYCYCECDKHLGHKSLLSCFIDSHAAT
jgi:hypothetical protein